MEPPTIQDDDDNNSSHGYLMLDENSLFLNANSKKNDGSSLDYEDFPLELEELKEDSYNSSRQLEEDNNSANATWVQLLNLPPANNHHAPGVPVGGMRRVSSCYFSIASNLSSDDNPSHNPYSAFVSPNPSYHSRHHHSLHHYDALSFEGRNASDFLLHDVLMNVFSFLDAHSLASFSETARRPNFECFYFLELQLQRALLMGEGHNHFEGGEEDDDDSALREEEVEEEHGTVEDGESDADSQDGDDDTTDDDRCRDVIPSFEGSIAGTGVISRLASLDAAKARKIVQTYLDSNASIHSMPLSHSLAYFRQVLLRGPPRRLASSATAWPPPPNVPENMAKNARNMALFFTFLGAAYMHAHQGGEAPPMPTMPDPSEVLNEENMEALKGMMLKVGLAGGFFKAGKTMKEKAEMKQNHPNQEDEGGHRLESVQEGAGEQDPSPVSVENDAGTSPAAVANSSPSLQARHGQPRSASIGSLEDLSHMMHPSAIASRLYNAFSNNNSVSAAAGSSSNISTANFNSNDELDSQHQHPIPQNEKNAMALPTRRHRSKRSHETLHHRSNVAGDELKNDNTSVASSWEETKSSEVGNSAADKKAEINHVSPTDVYEEQKLEDPSPEAIAFAMDHPFSPNPYDHLSSSTLHSMAGDGKIATNYTVAAATASSFFSFNMNQDSMSSQDESNVPTGCVGAYAHAVKTAASELTRLIKSQRKTNFDALPPAERHERGICFIDACTSDDKLPIVKRLLPVMDVDRFFIGPDDTETCALHAAAFNGAESVLQFLCGGIDERDPWSDRGLCDVNVRDANGWTALHFAAGANSVTSVGVLAGHGAKLTIEASNGYTPFHWAERLSNEEVAAELEKLGADNRFVGRWMFGGGMGATGADDRTIPFVSFLANRFFAFSS